MLIDPIRLFLVVATPPTETLSARSPACHAAPAWYICFVFTCPLRHSEILIRSFIVTPTNMSLTEDVQRSSSDSSVQSPEASDDSGSFGRASLNSDTTVSSTDQGRRKSLPHPMLGEDANLSDFLKKSIGKVNVPSALVSCLLRVHRTYPE